MNEIPELPEWIKDLIASADEDGFDRGYAAGREQMKNDLKGWLEGRHW